VSSFVDFIAAAGDDPGPKSNGLVPPLTGEREHESERASGGHASGEGSVGKFSALDASLQGLVAHNFPQTSAPPEPEPLGAWGAEAVETALDRNPDVWLYRKRTTALLRRYMRYSVETGRLPSIVGREMFRTRLSHYTVSTFEDRVIFVRDVERCLERLHKFDQQMIAKVVLQDHSYASAAFILNCARKTVERRVPEVLDLLSEAFLESRLIEPLPAKRPEEPVPEPEIEGGKLQ
jgi:DNA-directed RNA polymerase specialized sigma24 family protein